MPFVKLITLTGTQHGCAANTRGGQNLVWDQEKEGMMYFLTYECQMSQGLKNLQGQKLAIFERLATKNKGKLLYLFEYTVYFVAGCSFQQLFWQLSDNMYIAVVMLMHYNQKYISQIIVLQSYM